MLRLLGWVLCLSVVLCGLGLVSLKVSPWPSALFYRYLFDRAGIEMNNALAGHVPSGISTHADIAYGSEPAEKLDVHIPAALEGSAQVRPAIVWIHGGGFISGSKDQVANYLKILAANFYPVVGIDYTLAPTAAHPEPARQANAALAFIRANAARYNIDPNRIFLAGDSAGAHIAAQLAIAISAPDYARAIDVRPALPRSALRGLLLYCGIFDPDGMKAEGPLARFLTTVAWSYLGTRQASALPPQFSIVRNLTSAMPPMFVTAGNADPLLPHSRTLVDVATERGVAVDALFFADDHEPPLQHEYQFDLDTDAGREAMRRSLVFVAGHEQ